MRNRKSCTDSSPIEGLLSSFTLRMRTNTTRSRAILTVLLLALVLGATLAHPFQDKPPHPSTNTTTTHCQQTRVVLVDVIVPCETSDDDTTVVLVKRLLRGATAEVETLSRCHDADVSVGNIVVVPRTASMRSHSPHAVDGNGVSVNWTQVLRDKVVADRTSSSLPLPQVEVVIVSAHRQRSSWLADATAAGVSRLAHLATNQVNSSNISSPTTRFVTTIPSGCSPATSLEVRDYLRRLVHPLLQANVSNTSTSSCVVAPETDVDGIQPFWGTAGYELIPRNNFRVKKYPSNRGAKWYYVNPTTPRHPVTDREDAPGDTLFRDWTAFPVRVPLERLEDVTATIDLGVPLCMTKPLSTAHALVSELQSITDQLQESMDNNASADGSAWAMWLWLSGLTLPQERWNHHQHHRPLLASNALLQCRRDDDLPTAPPDDQHRGVAGPHNKSNSTSYWWHHPIPLLAHNHTSTWPHHSATINPQFQELLSQMTVAPTAQRQGKNKEVAVVWNHVCCHCCGFSEEVEHFIMSLAKRNRRTPDDAAITTTLTTLVGSECFCGGRSNDTMDPVRRAKLDFLTPPSTADLWHWIMDATGTPLDGHGGDNGLVPVIWVSHGVHPKDTSSIVEKLEQESLGLRSIAAYRKQQTRRSFDNDKRRHTPRKANKRRVLVVARCMYETSYYPHAVTLNSPRFAAIWVPSTAVKDSMLAGGVNPQRITIVPEAVDVDFYDPALHAKNIPLLRQERNNHSPLVDVLTHVYDTRPQAELSTVFLSIFKWEERKGWRFLLRSFLETFASPHPSRGGGQSSPTLVLLTKRYNHRAPHNMSGIFVESILPLAASIASQMGLLAEEQMASPCFTSQSSAVDDGCCQSAATSTNTTASLLHLFTTGVFPRIILIGDEVSPLQLATLFAESNAFILPTRGEGWGLATAQAMSMALPVITTNWGGSLEFATNETALLIDVEEMETVPSAFHDGGADMGDDGDTDAPTADPRQKWALPSVAHLSKLMKAFHDDPTTYTEMGQRARQRMKRHFSPDAVRAIVDAEIARLLAR